MLPFRQRLEITFITATTLPLLIALAEIGLRDGVMLPSNAAALVGAGVVSVVLFPAIAAALHRRGKAFGTACASTDSVEDGAVEDGGSGPLGPRRLAAAQPMAATSWP